MHMSLKCDPFLHAGDSCLIFQSKNVKAIGKQLNEDFINMCHWLDRKKLSDYFGVDKTKSILFNWKYKIKKIPKFDIIYDNIQRKQLS